MAISGIFRLMALTDCGCGKRRRKIIARRDMKLEIPESFYQEEERCGYLVSAHMKKVWAVELDLLYQLDQICRKYGIT